MNDPVALRMLLSHNFDLTPAQAPVLSRAAFTQIFIDGFSAHTEVQCRQVDNPHWIVEIVCADNFLTPQQVGEKCAQILTASRTRSIAGAATHRLGGFLQVVCVKTDGKPFGKIDFDILILGGIKTTPATSNSPDALQANQWGVDVVETKSGAEFLRSIGWESTIAGKPVESIFKVESIAGA